MNDIKQMTNLLTLKLNILIFYNVYKIGINIQKYECTYVTTIVDSYFKKIKLKKYELYIQCILIVLQAILKKYFYCLHFIHYKI